MIEAVPMGRPAIAALMAVVVLGACSSPPPSSGDGAGEPAFGEASLVIQTDRGDVRLRVQVADTTEERTRGLMFVEELPPDEGMVFLHDEPIRGTFHMKDTLIPLSLAVWGPNGRIRSMLDMEPCPEEPCRSYDPAAAWVGAVEVNQGFFDQRGVQVGDLVRLEREA
jgi:uncharacterized membrane protein (UPF0127 family)